MAREAARDLLAAMLAWTKRHPELAESLAQSSQIDAIESPRGSPWGIEDIEQLSSAEPGQVLTTCDAWARHATARAEGLASVLQMRAKQTVASALQIREEARSFRAEADELRNGRLLPLPRPDWAGPGDDSMAIGAVLDWQDGQTASAPQEPAAVC